MTANANAKAVRRTSPQTDGPSGFVGRNSRSYAPDLACRCISSKISGVREFRQGDKKSMTFLVLDSCIKCKYTDCVEVCPVDCFHEGPNMLVIDPEECIDCTLCEPECPVEAIVSEDDIPEGQEQFLELNAELSKSWPVLAQAKEAPEDADDWKDVKDKLQYLER